MLRWDTALVFVFVTVKFDAAGMQPLDGWVAWKKAEVCQKALSGQCVGSWYRPLQNTILESSVDVGNCCVLHEI